MTILNRDGDFIVRLTPKFSCERFNRNCDHIYFLKVRARLLQRSLGRECEIAFAN